MDIAKTVGENLKLRGSPKELHSGRLPKSYTSISLITANTKRGKFSLITKKSSIFARDSTYPLTTYSDSFNRT